MDEKTNNKLQDAMQEVDKGMAHAGGPRSLPRIFPAGEPENMLQYLKKIVASQVEILRELERQRRFLGMD